MHKRLFQCLKRTFMHFSCLVPPYFVLKKTSYLINWFSLSKFGGGRPETCKNVRFRALNAHLCISQVFPRHVLIQKLITSYFFLNPNMVEEELCHAKTCVSGPETHVYTCLRSSSSIFCLKNQFIKKIFYFKIWWGKT